MRGGRGVTFGSDLMPRNQRVAEKRAASLCYLRPAAIPSPCLHGCRLVRRNCRLERESVALARSDERGYGTGTGRFCTSGADPGTWFLRWKLQSRTAPAKARAPMSEPRDYRDTV